MRKYEADWMTEEQRAWTRKLERLAKTQPDGIILHTTGSGGGSVVAHLDLLTDLKTAYEKLGYTVIDSPIRPGQPLYADAGTDYYKGCHLSPDLCKEMKDWMQVNGFDIRIELYSRSGCVVGVYRDNARLAEIVDGTEELAVLRAFLEVTKEKSE